MQQIFKTKSICQPHVPVVPNPVALFPKPIPKKFPEKIVITTGAFADPFFIPIPPKTI